MRIAVDAHAIGRRLTGNEVYVRSLLNGFAAAKDRECEFLAYVSSEEACGWLPAGIQTSPISANPFLRLGCELSMKLRRDRPQSPTRGSKTSFVKESHSCPQTPQSNPP